MFFIENCGRQAFEDVPETERMKLGSDEGGWNGCRSMLCLHQESVHELGISTGYLRAICPLKCGGKLIRATIKRSQKENIQTRQR